MANLKRVVAGFNKPGFRLFVHQHEGGGYELRRTTEDSSVLCRPLTPDEAIEVTKILKLKEKK